MGIVLEFVRNPVTALGHAKYSNEVDWINLDKRSQ